MDSLLKKLYEKNNINKEKLLYLLHHLDEKNKNKLFDYARKTTAAAYGKKIFLRGLLEFSNYCNNNCLYCGLRQDNEKVERYRLSPQEIIKSFAKKAEEYRTLVLQSGEDEYFTDSRLTALIKEIKSQFPDTALTLSLGERSFESYRRLFEAGADRYLLRHETCVKPRYDRFHPGQSLNERKQCLQDLEAVGYQTGAGFIVGLPGQTLEDIADNLLFLKKEDLDMVGLGPLIPHPHTPLASTATGSVELTLICYALTRLLLPETLIPATTALNTLDPQGWEKGIKAGANVIMPNLSPASSRDKYEIYQEKGSTDISGINAIAKRVENTGFEIDCGRGDSLKWLKRKPKGGFNNE